MAYKNGDGKIPAGRFSLLLAGLFKKRKREKQLILTESNGTNERLNISFFGGKGGVGKTTCSTTFAFALAEKGVRTLLVSTDPAHSLFDLISTRKTSKVTENLWIEELDSDKAVKRYIQEVKQNLEKVTAPDMRKEVERQIDFAVSSPGANEAALFEEFVTIILRAPGVYDHVVFDTAPTGHTLRLLSLPELMEVWVDGMLAQRKKSQDMHQMLHNIAGVEEQDERVDEVYHLLYKRKERFLKVKEYLLDPDRTSFYFVLNPERLPIIETEKAIHSIKEHNIPIGGLIVNRVLPKEADGYFLAKRREREQAYLAEIEQRFQYLPKIYVPMQATDITKIDEIKALSQLFS